MTNPQSQSPEQRARIAYSDAVHAQHSAEAIYNSAYDAVGAALAALRAAMAETNARWDAYKVHLALPTLPAGEDANLLAPFGAQLGK